MNLEINTEDALGAYVCPIEHTKLRATPDGLQGQDHLYRYLPGLPAGALIPDFVDLKNLSSDGLASLSMYDYQGGRAVYKNFLSWLYRTFDVREDDFRRDLISRLRLAPTSKVLITGCGIGDDVFAVLDNIGTAGQVFASDLAPEMVVATYSALAEERSKDLSRVSLSVCDACRLPFVDGFFDAAFHFGGINLFDDVKLAISEMARVTKDGGRVVFGDEGVAPWLLDTEYGRMVIANNRLWAHQAPLGLLPFSALNPSVSWVLGNCFYVIDFEKDSNGPHINPDVQHVGRRGGSMRSRYFGQLEGVSPELRNRVIASAKEQGLSVTDWLERAVQDALGD